MPPSGPLPSPAVRILQGETISVIVWSNVAVTLASSWRVQYDDGSDDRISTDAFLTGSSRAAQYMLANQVARLDGYVTEGVVLFEGTGPAQRGQTYVQALVIMNPDTPTTTRQVLCAGYIYAGHAPTLGEIVEPGPAGGHGMSTTSQTSQPAAGADYAAKVVPAGVIWKVVGLSAQLVTAVAAANRFWHLIVATSVPATKTEYIADGVQIASLTNNYRGVQGVSPKTTATPNATGGMMLVSINPFMLQPTDTITPTTDNIQAADQWTGALTYAIEEWVMPN